MEWVAALPPIRCKSTELILKAPSINRLLGEDSFGKLMGEDSFGKLMEESSLDRLMYPSMQLEGEWSMERLGQFMAEDSLGSLGMLSLGSLATSPTIAILSTVAPIMANSPQLMNLLNRVSNTCLGVSSTTYMPMSRVHSV